MHFLTLTVILLLARMWATATPVSPSEPLVLNAAATVDTSSPDFLMCLMLLEGARISCKRMTSRSPNTGLLKHQGNDISAGQTSSPGSTEAVTTLLSNKDVVIALCRSKQNCPQCEEKENSTRLFLDNPCDEKRLKEALRNVHLLREQKRQQETTTISALESVSLKPATVSQDKHIIYNDALENNVLKRAALQTSRESKVINFYFQQLVLKLRKLYDKKHQRGCQPNCETSVNADAVTWLLSQVASNTKLADTNNSYNTLMKHQDLPVVDQAEFDFDETLDSFRPDNINIYNSVNDMVYQGNKNVLTPTSGGENMIHGQSIQSPLGTVESKSDFYRESQETDENNGRTDLTAHEISSVSFPKFLSSRNHSVSRPPPAGLSVVTKKSEDSLIEEPEGPSSSGTCQHIIEPKLLAFPGCRPKTVIFTRCQGSCHSRSVPDWDFDNQGVRQISHCTCCSAFVMKFKTLTFQCPGLPQRVIVKTIGFPFRCACRPCADVPEVSAQQPYDY